MNILMVGPNRNSKGGMATVIQNFHKYAGKNHIYFLSTWVENSRLDALRNALFSIKKIVKEQQIDVVHFHVAQKGSFFRKACLAKRLSGKTKVIFHMHASQFDDFYNQSSFFVRLIIKHIFSELDAVVVLSTEWKQFYEKITDTPLTVIENAVAVSNRNKYNPAAKNIVSFGRLGHRKGTYDILKVAAAIEKSFPDITFFLYGDGDEVQIQEEIEKKDLRNVVVGGWIDKAQQEKIVEEAVLHLLPSYNEGLPMSILETMAWGLPNLASNVGGIPQIITDKKNGLIIFPGDIQHMVEMLELFLSDEKLRKQLSAQAYKTINSRFSLKGYFDKWDQFYENI